MIEIIVSVLAFIIIMSLLGILVWHLKQANDQTQMLLMALKAKDAYEFKELTAEPVKEDQEGPDVLNAEDMDMKSFINKHIKNIVSDEE